MILHARDEGPLFAVFVRASFVRYLGEWLLDASSEERTEAWLMSARELTDLPAR